MNDEITLSEPEEDEQVESTENEATDQAVETDEEVSESSTDNNGEEVDTTANEPKKSGVQERIDELTAKRYQAEREAEYLREQLAKVQKPEQPQQKPQNTQPPQLDQYEDYDSYIVAKAKYELKQEQAEQMQAYREQQRKEQYDETVRKFSTRSNEARTKYSDYDQVIQKAYVPPNSAMEQAILLSEKGADVAYYLGKHPDEAQRIAQMPAMQAVMEMARVEMKLSQPRKQTNAQAPINPINTGKTVLETEEGPPGATYE
jgi:preprotein translocase subunit SecD